jgi:hypothetical protein
MSDQCSLHCSGSGNCPLCQAAFFIYKKALVIVLFLPVTSIKSCHDLLKLTFLYVLCSLNESKEVFANHLAHIIESLRPQLLSLQKCFLMGLTSVQIHK